MSAARGVYWGGQMKVMVVVTNPDVWERRRREGARILVAKARGGRDGDEMESASANEDPKEVPQG